MEVKINKEIRDYTEHMFFGLSLRQLFFSVLAVIAGLVLYFLLKDKVGTETISWACIMGAFPSGRRFTVLFGQSLDTLPYDDCSDHGADSWHPAR